MLPPFFFDQTLIFDCAIQQYLGSAAQFSDIPRRIAERSLEACQSSVSRIVLQRVELQIDEIKSVRSCTTLKTATPYLECLLQRRFAFDGIPIYRHRAHQAQHVKQRRRLAGPCNALSLRVRRIERNEHHRAYRAARKQALQHGVLAHVASVEGLLPNTDAVQALGKATAKR